MVQFEVVGLTPARLAAPLVNVAGRRPGIFERAQAATGRREAAGRRERSDRRVGAPIGR